MATVVFLLLFEWNWLRGPVGRWASTTYDREIELNGDLDVNLFSWTPSARVRDLRIGGPDWARAQDTVRVDDLLVAVRLRRLFVGQIEMPLLSITRPHVVLIADRDGRTSWTLHPDRPDDGQGMKLPPIQRLIITDGTLSLDERRRNVKLEATVTAREGSDEQAGFHLQGDGTLNGTPLTLTVRGGPFINIRRDRPYDFTAELTGVNSRLKADGAITRPFDLGRFNATLSLEGQDMADLYLLTGITLPNTPRYRLSGALSRDDALFRFRDFSGRVGSSDLSGDIRVDKVGDRRRVEATLQSQSLDIADLMTVLGAQPQVSAAGTTVTSGVPGRLLPDAALQTSRLRTMDGTLSYRVASVKRNDLEIRRVRLDAGLDGGVLTLDPVAFTFSRGELNGTARIDARKDVPYSRSTSVCPAIRWSRSSPPATEPRRSPAGRWAGPGWKGRGPRSMIWPPTPGEPSAWSCRRGRSARRSPNCWASMSGGGWVCCCRVTVRPRTFAARWPTSMCPAGPLRPEPLSSIRTWCWPRGRAPSISGPKP